MGCTSSRQLGISPDVCVSAAPAYRTGRSPKNGGITAALDTASSSGSESNSATISCDGPPCTNPTAQLITRAFEGEKAREDAVRSLRVVDTPVDDPRYDAITRLMASMSQAPVALITLITEDRVWFKSSFGGSHSCVVREGSWCDYARVPNQPEGGMRFGTLCVMDVKRRSFSAETYALMVNFASVVVQEMERDAAAMQAAREGAAMLADGRRRIAQLVGTAERGLALVDVRPRAWPVMYANEAFAQAEGGGAKSAGGCTSQGFWDLFEPVDGDSEGEMLKQIDAGVATDRPVASAIVASRHTGQRFSVVLRPSSTDQLAPSKPVGIPNWVPSERAAGSLSLQPGMLPLGGMDVGGGAIVQGRHAASDGGSPRALPPSSSLWSVEIESALSCQPTTVAALRATAAAAASTSAGSAGSAPAPGTPDSSAPAAAAAKQRQAVAAPAQALQTFASRALPEALEGLQMGPLLGSGSFGKVYRGVWHNEVVAVKLIACTAPSASNNTATTPAAAAVAEAEFGKQLDHPCIVKTYEYVMLDPEEGCSSGGTLWMVQQMCMRGTLIQAVDRGWLRQRRSLAAAPNMRAVLCTLREVAAGMAFLHSKNILHCDLTGNNVLLDARQPSASDARPYCVRVCDFGLSRVVDGEVCTGTYGTCSHMAPELMIDSILTPAADVWSFGVLCWEMYSGKRAYAGMRMASIIYTVTIRKQALELAAGAPAGFNELMQSCLNPDHKQRPSFEVVLAALDQLLAAEAGVPTAAQQHSL